jgi:tripartite-type tricarboxylate transporter receptor subunit TctC
MHDAVNKVLAEPDVATKLGQQGLEVRTLTRQQFADIVHDDVSKWAKIIGTLGIKSK